ncbi:TonB-dependent receptor plug domain-containing protein, partial [Xanthomonas arboricola]|uniref:TonB-dependent receptor plug domain-containing protein n=1 Tax=Xanthomonas arboricola TaxID=56448 RepID=UPI002157F39A
PVSDTFSFGSYLNANRNFVDLETLKRVEVVRGPASSLYGSDALERFQIDEVAVGVEVAAETEGVRHR